MKLKTKLFLVFLLYGFLLVGFALFINTTLTQSQLQKKAIEDAEDRFVKNRELLTLYIENIQTKLVAIEDSPIFQKFVRDKNKNLTQMQEFLYSIAESDNFIMQVRYLNKNAQEIIRIERSDIYATPRIVPTDKLQNKKQRYYFQKIFTCKKHKFWTSNLDLNVEHSKIEIPYKPVIRIGMPVFSGNEKIGVIIFNVFMKKILHTLSSTKLYDIYIVDKEGYFIIHPDSKYNWSRYLKTSATLKDFFPQYKEILSKNEYKTDTFYSAVLNVQNPDGLRMIVRPVASFVNINQNILWQQIFISISVLLFLSLPFFLILTKPYIKLKNETRKNKLKLEQKVQEKTKELQSLNATLENVVRERTNEQNILLSLFDLGDAVLFKWRNDDNWSVEYVSQSVQRLLGYSTGEFLNSSITYAECIHPDDIKRVIEEVETAIEKQLYFFTHRPYRIITREKKTKWIHDSTVIVRNKQREIVHFVGYLIDISEIKESELKLKLLSTTDTLTKIYNRLYLDEMLQQQYYRLVRNDEVSSIVMMDIDFFKKINDTHGHLIGDEVLMELTNLIKNNIRESDIFGRWGGEEFMLIAPYTTKDEAHILAEKLRSIIQNHRFNIVKKVTLSFGVTQLSKAKTLDENIIAADKALYHSKKNGRNRVSVL